MKKILLILLAAVTALSSCVQDKTHLVENEDYIDLTSQYDGESFEYDESLWYINELKDVPIPDPFVFVEGDTYYIVGTSDRNINVVDCYVTEDFVTYETHYAIYDPSLYEGWEADNPEIYAPEIYCFDGVYYMYYSAEGDAEAGIGSMRSCSVVVADNPLGPYKPLANDEVDGLRAPLFAHENYPNRMLDTTVFVDDDGKMYMYFVTRTDVQHIVGLEMISPYEVDWSTYREFVIPGTPDSESDEILLEWEVCRDSSLKIAEAPFMLKSGDKYYLTYSVNGAYNKFYNVCYAVSDTPMGNFVKPYEEGKDWTNLLLGCPGINDPDSTVYKQWGGFASGTGHHCFFYAGDELMIGYHAHKNRDWNSKYYTERYYALDYVYFNGEGVPYVNGPTYSFVNLPESISGVKNIANGKISGNNVQNVQNALDNYLVDCYNLDSRDNEVILGSGESYIDIEFDRAYEIQGILIYNSAYYDSYIIEIEYIDFGNGNVIYYPQFCEDFYVNDETGFIRPASGFNLEILNTFTAERVRIGFNLPNGGAINEIVILGK